MKLLQTLVQLVVNLGFSIYFLFFSHPEDENVQKIISLYSDSQFSKNFAKIRFWDSPYLEIEKLIPKKGKIVDLGCGDGIFANYLAVSIPTRQIFGIEIDQVRLSRAPRGLMNTKFITGDITKIKIPPADCIILFHVLHHLTSYSDQDQLIEVITQKLSSNGLLVIVEIEPKFSFKFIITWLVDHFLVPMLFEKRLWSDIYFRKSTDWVNLLKRYQFKTQTTPAEDGKPFSHVIISARRQK